LMSKVSSEIRKKLKENKEIKLIAFYFI